MSQGGEAYLSIDTGPMEMLSFASVDAYIKSRTGWPTPNVEFDLDYVAESMEPVTPSGGARIMPSKTFAEVEGKQFDIILVPGGKLPIEGCSACQLTCQEQDRALVRTSSPQ